MGPYIKFISGVIVLTYDSNYRGEITPIKPIDFKVPISLHHDRLGAHLVYPYPRMPPKKLRSPRTWGRGWKSFSPHFKKKKKSWRLCCCMLHVFPPVVSTLGKKTIQNNGNLPLRPPDPIFPEWHLQHSHPGGDFSVGPSEGWPRVTPAKLRNGVLFFEKMKKSIN